MLESELSAQRSLPMVEMTLCWMTTMVDDRCFSLKKVEN